MHINRVLNCVKMAKISIVIVAAPDLGLPFTPGAECSKMNRSVYGKDLCLKKETSYHVQKIPLEPHGTSREKICDVQKRWVFPFAEVVCCFVLLMPYEIASLKHRAFSPN